MILTLFLSVLRTPILSLTMFVTHTESAIIRTYMELQTCVKIRRRVLLKLQMPTSGVRVVQMVWVDFTLYTTVSVSKIC